MDKKVENQKGKKPKKPFNWKKFLLLCVLAILPIITIYNTLTSSTVESADITYAQFMSDITDNKVDYIVKSVGSNFVKVYYTDGTEQRVTNPDYDDFTKDMLEKGVEIKYQALSVKESIISLVMFISFITCIVLAIKHFMPSASRFRSDMGDSVTSTITFDDVAGLGEEKEELKFMVKSLQLAKEMEAKGLKPTKGVLLAGPPGVGKTLLAKAVAGEAGLPFYSISGSEFVEVYAGLGASRVRNVFAKARKNAPCILFIDEIDAVGRRRESRNGGGDTERDQTLNQLLTELDGFHSDKSVVILAATNRADMLDSALLRPGRFDKTIHISGPSSKKDREDIVAVHLRGKTLAEDVTIEQIGKACFGLSGASIASALNDAVLESFKDNRNGDITLKDINIAIMKLYAKGLAKGVHDEKVLHRVAIHEVGHALMNEFVGRKVIKVEVQPYSSGIGGVTMIDGDSLDSQTIRSVDDFKNDIKVLYGGLVAEELVLGTLSNGASNDLERATLLLRDMVGSYAMGCYTIALNTLTDNDLVIDGIDTLVKDMDKIAKELKEEVKEYLSQVDVMARLHQLADKLKKEEVLYDLNLN
ncbi:ATP-dependent zinc metalloprotease FtsH 3 [compost metagenome]